MAEKFEKWLRNANGRRHLPEIQKLYERYHDPKMTSQAFFNMREMGVRQKDHVGIRIVNHWAAGERLLLESGKIPKNSKPQSSHQ
ncbi:MAG: hypothetical protein KIH08_06390 [Candidatus Freyarchaeota archaeon]|nr:hypothetical protein [Candidatus Jordarchaeia archaeon]MBS7269248.1 hypothetical protein [Candidatus Jordarchaeia archaeon]MBS7280118.1 hypothetical protein [Candidatus Jordarchaeia archaeon]